MGRLVIVASHVCKLEELFLQDNVQAFRQELRKALKTLEAIPEDQPVADSHEPGEVLDLPENWL